jgi:hypothetical protein
VSNPAPRGALVDPFSSKPIEGTKSSQDSRMAGGDVQFLRLGPGSPPLSNTLVTRPKRSSVIHASELTKDFTAVNRHARRASSVTPDPHAAGLGDGPKDPKLQPPKVADLFGVHDIDSKSPARPHPHAPPRSLAMIGADQNGDFGVASSQVHPRRAS